MFSSPFLAFFFFLYLVILGVLFAVLQVGAITFVFTRIGVPAETVFTLLLLSLLGSYINIPLKRMHSDLIEPGRIISFYGWKFEVPGALRRKESVLAVNLGGAIVPSLVSLYLVLTNIDILLPIALAVGIVSLIVFRLARPLKGVGIVIPTFVPPIAAAVTALIISRPDAPIIAYIAGTMGTLIGADILNLNKISGLGAPVASIGGAGTFDGVFLTGIIAVLLTSFGI
ncbi:MAG: DUF1614 domain-containing protein [Syntrophaceae bacterium]